MLVHEGDRLKLGEPEARPWWQDLVAFVVGVLPGDQASRITAPEDPECPVQRMVHGFT